MEAAFLIIFGAITLLTNVLAFRTDSEANRLASLFLAADFFGSQIVKMTTEPPVRPLLYIVINVVIIFQLARNLDLFADKAVMRIAFALGYIVMILANLFYLATYGQSKVVYSVTVIVVFIALAMVVWGSSIRDGALVGMWSRRVGVAGGGTDRSMEG